MRAKRTGSEEKCEEESTRNEKPLGKDGEEDMSILHKLLFRHRALSGIVALGLVCLLPGCPPTDNEPPEDPNPGMRLFLAALKYPTAQQPFAVVAADFNGDGRTDLATANQGANNVSVLLAKAAGGYARHVDYAVGTLPSAIIVADVNGDLQPDLVAANNGSSDVSVLVGAADGTFGSEVRVALPTNAQPLAMAAADLNGNNTVDLVTADYGIGSVSVLLGVGDGTFDAPVRYVVGDQPRSVAIADLNGDGKPDVVTANRATNNISILTNQGNGVFGPSVNRAVGMNPRMVAAVDLNGDHWLDLITTNPGSGDISVLMNQGGGTFANEVRTAFENYLPTRFVMADFNGDGQWDLATLLFSTGADPVPMGLAAVLLGDGAGGFGAPRIFGVGIASFDLIAAHMNGDSRLDLVTADPNVNQVSLAYGQAGGAFECEERFPVGTRPRMVAVSDLNRDNKPDLVVINQDSHDMSILMGHGDGVFEPETRVAISDLPRALAVGRLNPDDFPDIVVTNFNLSRVSVFLGKGDGTFQNERVFSVRTAGSPYISQPRSVALADLDGDTITDIVTGNANTDSVAVLLGLGNGTFGSPTETVVGNFPLDVNLVDLNADGKLDLVFVSTNDPENANDQALPRVVRRLGKGDGTFDETTNLRVETGPQPRGLAIGDLHGAGNLDAVTVHPGDDSVYILRGSAGGQFLRGERFRMGAAPNTVALADVNGDHLLDIVTTNDINVVSVLVNRGDGLFYTFMNYPAGSEPIGGVVADVNRDGHPDVIVVNRATNDVSVLLGAP